MNSVWSSKALSISPPSGDDTVAGRITVHRQQSENDLRAIVNHSGVVVERPIVAELSDDDRLSSTHCAARAVRG